MIEYKLGAVESKFADIIWSNEPLTTNELIKLCQNALTWKRTTTYTVLKKLCEKGLFQTKESIVTSLVSREDYYSMQSQLFVKDAFDGSLSAFLTAFTKRRALSEDEISEICKMIENAKEE